MVNFTNKSDFKNKKNEGEKMTAKPRELTVEEVGQLKTLIEEIYKAGSGVFSGGDTVLVDYKNFQFSFGNGYCVTVGKGESLYADLWDVDYYIIKVFNTGADRSVGEKRHCETDFYNMERNGAEYNGWLALNDCMKDLFAFIEQEANQMPKQNTTAGSPGAAEQKLKDLIDKK